jgi:hypothetical protein
VQAWYQGGLSLIDFTDSAKPVEIGYFDRGPIDAEQLVLGGYWSVYFFGGRVYGTEIVRGLDVFELLPSAQMSANEIAAAGLADQGAVFNPQQQFPVRWPAEPVVARAYLEQLGRDGRLDADLAADIAAALDDTGKSIERGARDRELARRLGALAQRVLKAPEGSADGPRRAALAGVLDGLADRVSARQRS